MLLLGLVLLGAAGAFAVLLVTQNSATGPDYTVSLFGFHLGQLTTPQAFLAGMVLALVFCLGVALAIASVMRAHHHRAVRTAEQREAIRIRAERDELASRLGIAAGGLGDDYDDTMPLAPTLFPWANPW